VAYLADGRELADPGAGDVMAGKVSIRLPDGDYELSLYSPVSGESSPGIAMKGGVQVSVALPEFRQDIVVRVMRRE